MGHTHTVSTLRGVSVSDRTRYRDQWWDKPCIDDSLTSVAVGASHGWRYWQEGATTFGEPMAEKRMNVQNSVLRAVCRGYRYSGDIAAAAGIRKVEVFAHLRRLMAKGLVECYRCTHSASRKAYSVTSIKVVLLEKLWTKTEATCHAKRRK